MMPEKIVQNSIIEYIKSLQKDNFPIYYERRIAQGITYKKGLPDLFVIYNGYHIEVEVKRESGGKLSPFQIKYKDYFEKIGVKYVCCSSLNDFKSFLLTC